MIDSYSLKFPATHSVRNKKAVKNLSVRGDESGRPVGRTKCHGIHTQALHAEGIISLPSQMPDATAEKNEDRGVRSPWMERELRREEREEMDCNDELRDWNRESLDERRLQNMPMTGNDHLMILDYRSPFDVQLFIGYKLMIALYIYTLGWISFGYVCTPDKESSFVLGKWNV